MKQMRIASGLVLALAVSVVAAAHAGSSAPRIQDGVYRANVSEAFLRAAGVPAVEAAHNGGIQTLIFKGKRWTNKTRNRYHPPDCPGNLSYAGGRVSLTLDRGPGCATVAGHLLFSARWSYSHGELRFTAIQPTDILTRTAWGGKPWQKIG